MKAKKVLALLVIISMMQGLKPLVKNFYFASKLNLEPCELHILF